MSNSKELQDKGSAPAFHGNPIFNGPVLFNSTWNAEANAHSRTEQNDEIYAEDELDANVEECSSADYEDLKEAAGVYSINTHPKGRILILNNEFKNKMKRSGSQLDVSNMMALWQSLGFAVEIVSDLTSDGMQQTVRDFVTSESMKKANICAILVMSHGEKDDFIVGDKHTKLSVMNIVEEVKKSEILHGKPKLLFFQMCRGSQAEKFKQTPPGLRKTESDSVPITDVADQSDSNWLRNMLDTLLPKTQRKKSVPAVTMPQRYSKHPAGPQRRYDGVQGRLESDSPRRVESDAGAWEYTDRGGEDLMIAFATQPDHVAFRGQDGSWFVSAIARQFKLHAKDHDLLKLMEFVKDDVCKKRSYAPTTRPKYHDCVAAVEASDSFLGKKLYFFPGYPNTRQ